MVNLVQRPTLADLPPFSGLPAATLESLTQSSKVLRYRIGQTIVRPKGLPQLVVLLEGQARLLGMDPRSTTGAPLSLSMLGPGALVGILGFLRGIACEQVIASTEVVGLNLSTVTLQRCMDERPSFGQAIREKLYLSEVFDLLATHITDQALDVGDLRPLTEETHQQGVVRFLPYGKVPVPGLGERVWFLSSGTVLNHPVGSRLEGVVSGQELEVISPQGARLVGLPVSSAIARLTEPAPADSNGHQPTVAADPTDDIPYAAEDDFPAEAEDTPVRTDYPFVKGRGPVDNPLACLEMVSKQFEMPFRRDVIRKILANQHDRIGELSLAITGKVGEFMGLKTQLAKVPASAVHRLPTPALIQWQEGQAVLYESTSKVRVLAVPDQGIIQRSPTEFEETWGAEGEVLLVEKTKETPEQRFGLSWFLPSLQRYRWILAEVLLASFFVQLFGLANPLMVQVIIDRVIVQNSIDTLHVLGTFLIIVAIAEAVLTALRTYLFVDTTNRIDMALGSEIIDHLFRLPLRYFDRRPVGELSSRVNELENIRQFLTGTALTVVLDAVFSVVYIVVMMIYSWILTLVALATIPLFVLLTVLVSPIVRRQLRDKAEKNAATQSYLVEALSGIQTVKAQNIELRTRWNWQQRYARYVSAGFKTVITSTTAGSASTFLEDV
ncbi:MAG: peptidase domain-containing ABC transporter [Cyanobacteria bacterium]|nr:peptidase domain-containing ABC transporter [Cyanobacteriota bacterium]MDA0867629.1 peptidase domain-containing ABC transporter [Cyanobacteriota bacterium]